MFKLQFEKDIQEIRHRIANKALIFGSLLGILAYSGSILTISETGLKVGHFTDPVTLLLFIIVWYYRNRVSLGSKVWVVVFGILVLVLTNVYKSGIYSDNIVLLALIPVFSLMALPLRRTIMVYIIAVTLMLVLLFLQKQGLIEVGSKNYVFRLHSVEVWLINILLITIVAFTFVIVNQQFNRKFSDLIAQLEANNLALAEKEQNYREIFNASADAIFIHNIDGKIIDVNDAMLRLYGYSEKDFEEFAVEKLSALDFNYQTDSIQKKFNEVLIKGTQVFDWHARNSSGKEFWVEVTLKKATIGGHDRVLAFVRDIDEKKAIALKLEEYQNNLENIIAKRTHELQNLNEDLMASNEAMNQQKEALHQALEQLQSAQIQLVEKEKMASVGVLATGVAHEINNPLNYIKASAYALRSYIDEHEGSEAELSILLSAINQGVDRAASIVLSLNQLNRNIKDEKWDCDLHQIINNPLCI